LVAVEQLPDKTAAAPLTRGSGAAEALCASWPVLR
jgi:hypothetical protein